jgi:hypothetical protein
MSTIIASKISSKTLLWSSIKAPSNLCAQKRHKDRTFEHELHISEANALLEKSSPALDMLNGANWGEGNITGYHKVFLEILHYNQI